MRSPVAGRAPALRSTLALAAPREARCAAIFCSSLLAAVAVSVAVAAGGCDPHVLAVLPGDADTGAPSDAGSEAPSVDQAGDRGQPDAGGGMSDTGTEAAASDGARDAAPDSPSDGGAGGDARDAPDAADAADAAIEALAVPPEVLAWEPIATTAGAKVTAIAVGSYYTVVGLSNGEIYLAGSNAMKQAVPSWTRADKPEGPPGQAPLPPRAAVSALALDRGSPPRIWAGYTAQSTGRKIWYTASGGRSWSDLPGPYDDVLSISVSPFNANVLVVPTVRNTLFTMDGGVSWGPVYASEAVFTFPGIVQAYAVGVDDSGGRRVWVGDSGGHVLYADVAEGVIPTFDKWVPVTAAFPARGVTALTVSATNPKEIWVTFGALAADNVWSSSDDGATWSNRHTALLPISASDDFTRYLGPVTPHPFYPYLYLTETIMGSPAPPPTFFSVNAGAAWWPR